MYYYYFATAGGRRIWWKKYLTTLQITQFIIDLFAVYFASYAYYASNYGKHFLPSPGNCAGSEGAAAFGCALLTSYLLLFINFYIQTYKKGSSKRSSGKPNGSTKANGNSVKTE